MDSHRLPPPPLNYWAYDITEVRNPYGAIEAGWAVPFRSGEVIVQARHMSSIGVNDFGMNSLEVAVRWRPFK